MIIFTTTLGDIKIALDFDKAPITAKNFQTAAQEGFYNGTIFHRVIKGFMVQGGGFSSDMADKAPRAKIQNEANNGLKNNRGTLAMARMQAPHSASCQFFINLVDNDFLNFKNESEAGWGYCVFGEVIEGMDVVDKMTLIATGRSGMHSDVPLEEILITATSIE